MCGTHCPGCHNDFKFVVLMPFFVHTFMVNIIIIVLMACSVVNCVNISVLIEGKKIISGTQSH